MKENQKTKATPKQTPKSETLDERVHRHISDIHSEITDEDIRNVKTELEIRTKTDSASDDENEQESKTTPENQQKAASNELSEGND